MAVPNNTPETISAMSWLAAAAAHIGFGVGLFLATTTLFERLEKRMSRRRKDGIALRLLDANATQTLHHLQSSFLPLFNKLFADKHWSWKCFWRSFLCTIVSTLIVMLGREFLQPPRHALIEVFTFILLSSSGICASILPDYISLWKTRYFMTLSHATKSIPFHLILLAIDIIVTFILAACAAFIGNVLVVAFSLATHLAIPIHGQAFHLGNIITGEWFAFLHLGEIPFPILLGMATVWFIPEFFGRLWLFAYLCSGLLLKFTHRFDIAFKWFNSWFDVEDHPLESIGTVTGGLLALGYWALAVIHLLP